MCEALAWFEAGMGIEQGFEKSLPPSFAWKKVNGDDDDNSSGEIEMSQNSMMDLSSQREDRSRLSDRRP